MYFFTKRILNYLSRLLRFKYYRQNLRLLGRNVKIETPIRFRGLPYMSICNDVSIAKSCWIEVSPIADVKNAQLYFGEGCAIGDFNHIFATHSIRFEKNVLTASSVYVTDNLHEYANICIPIINQPIKQLRAVFIGEGSWLGEHVCVIGASIGKHCVIGANSVVTHDIPDYCVAVGSPARIIKRYNPQSETWEKTDKDGNFITN